MIDAYLSGDPYLTFGKQAGVLPDNATKQTHGFQREQFKACALGVLFGMGARSLARRINRPEREARELLRLHHETYWRFWEWSDGVVDHAMLMGEIKTVFGWTLHVGTELNPRSIRNFPMQANGAEMLRLACCFAVEQGLRVAMPVHDALLVESPLASLEKDVERTRQAMGKASRVVLDGFELRTDVHVVRHPDRYIDERGRNMWETVCEILRGLPAAPVPA
jgi:DNA polymerase I-like protein with 3'-5' exonuclease and polymerase domains